MNDQTAQLLRELAAKLGTTSEYLWSVLVRQASVSATTTLLYLISVIILGIILYKAHRRFSKKAENDRYNNTVYEDLEWPIGVMVIGGLGWLVLALALFFSFPDIINGYFNPEYWALNKILKEL